MRGLGCEPGNCPAARRVAQVRGSWGLSVEEMRTLRGSKRLASLPDFVTYPYFEAAGQAGVAQAVALGLAPQWPGWDPRAKRGAPPPRMWNCTRAP